jgi:alginate O-acetyltransferase complex protein AlgI
MIFHSLDFLIFFALVLALYWRLPHRGQNLLLIAASWFFYGYVHWWFLLPLAFTAGMDYFVARGIERWPGRRTPLLCLSLCASLGMLGFFKYYNFFVENFAVAFRSLGLEVGDLTLRVFLPVGISFYTFQSIGYVVDVYRGRARAVRHFPDYLLYSAFFPQLVAGPIERSVHLLPQIQGARHFDWERARGAVLLILWGFFKKLVIADNVAVTANRVFALENPAFPVLWAGVFAFAVQIFADFSAYTDIARGTARLLGFDLMENFRHPYLARSPQEFWQRWHISLSTWFRDYVYIPLGGSRKGPVRIVFNLLFTFFLSGLWHGASWNYVLWGLWYGVWIVIYRAFGAAVPARISGARWLAFPRWLLMFVLILVGWLLFRETSTPHLVKYLTLNPLAAKGADWTVGFYLLNGVLLFSLPIWIHHVAGLLPADAWERFAAMRPRTAYALQLAAGVAFFTGILLLRSRVTSDFIYFQF